MRKRIAGSIVLLVLTQGSALAHSVPVRINNALSSCVSIHITDTTVRDNMVLANTAFRVRKPISECGCRSALVGYSSATSVNTAEQVLQNGLLAVSRSGNKKLVLASEQALIADRQLQLQFQCAPAL